MSEFIVDCRFVCSASENCLSFVFRARSDGKFEFSNVFQFFCSTAQSVDASAASCTSNWIDARKVCQIQRFCDKNIHQQFSCASHVMANFEKLLSENLASLNDRIGRYGGISQHPYGDYQVVQRYPAAQMTVTSSPIANPFGLTQGGIIDHHTLMNSPIPANSEIGPKFSSSGTGYAHSALESQSYGAPQWPSSMSSKDGKLKGAALSRFSVLLESAAKLHERTHHSDATWSEWNWLCRVIVTFLMD